MLKEKQPKEPSPLPYLLSALVVVVCTLLIIWISSALTENRWKQRAVTVGRAEYYWDEFLDKQWRWKSKDEIADEVISNRARIHPIGKNIITIEGNFIQGTE